MGGGGRFTAASVATGAKNCVADCLRSDLLGPEPSYINAS